MTCRQPDRDEPRIKCGYPLPCPFHTIVVDGVEGAADLLDRIARAKRTVRRARARRVLASPEAR